MRGIIGLALKTNKGRLAVPLLAPKIKRTVLKADKLCDRRAFGQLQLRRLHDKVINYPHISAPVIFFQYRRYRAPECYILIYHEFHKSYCTRYVRLHTPAEILTNSYLRAHLLRIVIRLLCRIPTT